MTRALLLSLLMIVIAAPGTLAGAAEAGKSDDTFVVYCHDTATDTLSHKLAGDCKGRVVSDKEAATIRKRRISRIQKALKGGPPPVAPGKKLASIGTGFFVAPDGHIVTNNHVIDGCEIISATAALGGDIATADLIDTDVRNDLALLRTKLPPPATATFRSPADLDSGRPVAVIGYPTQGMAPLKPFFTAGFTTDSDGGIPNIPPTLFQIKAKVRPGNSGGPVLNDSGHVIGVIFAKIDTPGFFQNTGKVVRDIGFVVRNPILFRMLDRHDVTYQTAATGSAVPQDRLLDLSRPFVARIGCWK